MPIPIVQHSADLCNFLLPLLVGLNAFQQLSWLHRIIRGQLWLIKLV